MNGEPIPHIICNMKFEPDGIHKPSIKVINSDHPAFSRDEDITYDQIVFAIAQGYRVVINPEVLHG